MFVLLTILDGVHNHSASLHMHVRGVFLLLHLHIGSALMPLKRNIILTFGLGTMMIQQHFHGLGLSVLLNLLTMNNLLFLNFKPLQNNLQCLYLLAGSAIS